MIEMEKIDVNRIRIGVCFSEHVYFEDGKNMFLAAGKTAKPYHIAALRQWKIPYLLTKGKEIDPSEYVPSHFSDANPIEEIEEL